MVLTADYKTMKNTIKNELEIHKQEIEKVHESIVHYFNGGKPIKPIKNESKMNVISERNELKSNLLQLNILYQNEKKLRKKLLEEVIDLKGNIRVFCRVRPKIKREITANMNDNDKNKNNNELQPTTCLNDETIVLKDSNKKELNFDQIYKPNSSQNIIFEDVKP